MNLNFENIDAEAVLTDVVKAELKRLEICTLAFTAIGVSDLPYMCNNSTNGLLSVKSIYRKRKVTLLQKLLGRRDIFDLVRVKVSFKDNVLFDVGEYDKPGSSIEWSDFDGEFLFYRSTLTNINELVLK